jgi:hypothetical protein
MNRTAWFAGLIVVALPQLSVAFANGVDHRCGGFFGQCDSDLVCDFDFRNVDLLGGRFSCRASNHTGSCIHVPMTCEPIADQVCGCRPNEVSPFRPDRRSFPNDWERQKAHYLLDRCVR